MVRKTFVPLYVGILFALSAPGELAENQLQAAAAQNFAPNVALLNGQWFNGKSFAARTVYSVNGRFAAKKPARVDRTLDLAGTWIVPPFGEADNHNLGTGIEEWGKQVIQKYLADGVFYVKIQGNLPLTDEIKRRLSLNRPDGADVVLAQGSLTATGGWPIPLVERILLPQGILPRVYKSDLEGPPLLHD